METELSRNRALLKARLEEMTDVPMPENNLVFVKDNLEFVSISRWAPHETDRLRNALLRAKGSGATGFFLTRSRTALPLAKEKERLEELQLLADHLDLSMIGTLRCP